MAMDCILVTSMHAHTSCMYANTRSTRACTLSTHTWGMHMKYAHTYLSLLT